MQATKPTIKDAMNALLGMCDGARAQDGTGFNRFDSAFIRNLPRELTQRQQTAVYHLLRKYSNQLERYGIPYGSIEKPETDPEVEKRKNGYFRLVGTAENPTGFDVSFSYDPQLVEQIKKVPGARYQPSTRTWFIPYFADSLSALNRFSLRNCIIDDAGIFDHVQIAPTRTTPDQVPSNTQERTIEYDGQLIIRFPYSQTDVDRVKNFIPGARWDKDRKVWTTALTIGSAEAARSFAGLGFTLTPAALTAIDGLVNKAQANIEMSRAEESDHGLDMAGFLKTPRPFQFTGIKYGITNERTMIADEMGLGKTIQLLGIIYALKITRALVLCPASLKTNWGVESASCLPAAGRVFFSFRKDTKKHYNKEGEYLCTEYPYSAAPLFAPDFLIVICDSKAPADLVTRANLVVINYDLLSAEKDKDAKKKCVLTPLAQTAIQDRELIGCDESHKCKNDDAQRTMAAKQMAAGIKYRYLLTGTPIVNRPMELPSQLEIIGRLADFGGSWKFKQRYCGAHQIPIGRGRSAWDFSGATHLDELNERLRAACYIRRTKEQVLKELPPKTYETLHFELSNRAEYTKAEKNLIGYVKEVAFMAEKERLEAEGDPDAEAKAKEHADDKAMKTARAQILTGIGILRKLCAAGKIAAVKDWVSDFMEGEGKLIIFAHHVEVQKELLAACRQWGAVSVAGADNSQTRAQNVSTFQTDAKCRIVICSLQAAAEGITLTASSTVLFVEQPWTPGAKLQAEDRAHRLGAIDNVTIYDTIAPQSFDEDLQALLREKSEVVQAVADGDQTASVSQLQEILTRIQARHQ
jgi:SWI/SNF-related matrix-associated actin-dependent regulator of chromatin subfamily A-like protein 1